MRILTRRIGESIAFKLPTGEVVQVALGGVQSRQVWLGAAAAIPPNALSGPF